MNDEADGFFTRVTDIVLISVALLSSGVSLVLPFLYYVRRQCRQHPTVLLANISLLEAVANFNIVVMAWGLYGLEHVLHIRQVFHVLTFDIDILPSEEDFCMYNYCIYMALELLSLSFHICYSVDLFITLKFPFLNGRKRRKFYYLFSLVFPVATLLLSIKESEQICQRQIASQSIYKVPIYFLASVTIFGLVSLVVIVISFCQKAGRAKIRRDYIRQHRIVLILLELLWACPVTLNFLIRLKVEHETVFHYLDIATFFSLVSSSGIITLYRIASDPYLRQRTKALCTRQPPALNPSFDHELIAEDKRERPVNEEVWNLPLAGAMNEFQSQQVVHSIIQVVSQACAERAIPSSRLSSAPSHYSLYESVFPTSSIVIDRTCEKIDRSFVDMFRRRQEQKVANKDPNECSVKELTQICKRKRHFNMVWLAMTDPKDQSQESRLLSKTVHINKRRASQASEASKLQRPQQANRQSTEAQILDIKVTSYSHRVFEALRQNEGLSGAKIGNSLELQKNVASIQKAKQSLGASGSFFFFSADHMLIIKTISEDEKNEMIEMLPKYFEHMRYNPNSLIARTFGVFSVEIAGTAKIYFTLMENAFRGLQMKSIPYKIYDMKGSTVSRQVKDLNAAVFKDINYFRSKDCFMLMTPSDRQALLDQAEKDLAMLKSLNVMDFSLLLGVGRSRLVHSRKCLEPRNPVQDFRLITNLEELSGRVYSLSIIDHLQTFNMGKKMELWMKKLFKGGGNISSIDTAAYHRRFMKMLESIVVPIHLPKGVSQQSS